MDRMASIIELSEWKGYRGDMGQTEKHAYYTKWTGIDGRLSFIALFILIVIFHLAPMMGAEGHRPQNERDGPEASAASLG